MTHGVRCVTLYLTRTRTAITNSREKNHGNPRVVHADSHMWYPEREAEGDAHYGLWESNINAILPDGADYSDYAGDNYMRALICRVTPVAD